MKTLLIYIVAFCFLQKKCFCLTDDEIAKFKSRSFINKNSGAQVMLFYNWNFFENFNLIYLFNIDLKKNILVQANN